MCDYSLMAVPNRLAICGEELVTHRFETGSLGLTSPLDKKNDPPSEPVGFWAKLKKLFVAEAKENCTAVCIPPGARLLVRDIPRDVQKRYGFTADSAEVVFTETSAGVGFRDAICLPDGTTILLQQLSEG